MVTRLSPLINPVEAYSEISNEISIKTLQAKKLHEQQEKLYGEH